MARRNAARILLYLSATLVLLGGGYDLLTPYPPSHHVTFLGTPAAQIDPRTAALLRGLFRALGGALVGIGVAAFILIRWGICRGRVWASVALLALVGITEGVNASQMYRVGSPYWAPLAFIALLVAGLALSHWPTPAFGGQSDD